MSISVRKGTNAEWEANKSNIITGEPVITTDSKRAFYGTDTGQYMELSNIDLVAAQYNSSITYNRGNYCIYQGKLYVCKSNGITGSWDSSYWNNITIQQSFDDLTAKAVPLNVREAIYQLLNSAAYAETGLTDEISVVQAWAEEVLSLTLSSYTLELNGSTPQTIIATAVPSSATVNWSSSDPFIATVSNGVVTGVHGGTCTITAAAGNLIATCSVIVSGLATLESISAVYTQTGDVFVGDSLDVLKTDLVITATYSDESTAIISADSYSLSGTLEAGTSVITATYGSKTATFNVPVYGLYKLPSTFASTGSNYIDTDVAYELGNQYTIVCTFSISSFRSSALTPSLATIFGDTHGEQSYYSALQEQDVASGGNAGKYVWGMGLGWSNGKNIVSENDTVKFIYTLDIGTTNYERHYYFKNVSTLQSMNDGGIVDNVLPFKGYDVFLGKQETENGVGGFVGNISDFKIYNRVFTANEINAYMG